MDVHRCELRQSTKVRISALQCLLLRDTREAEEVCSVRSAEGSWLRHLKCKPITTYSSTSRTQQSCLLQCHLDGIRHLDALYGLLFQLWQRRNKGDVLPLQHGDGNCHQHLLAPDLPAHTLQGVIVCPWGQPCNACAPPSLSTHTSSGNYVKLHRQAYHGRQHCSVEPGLAIGRSRTKMHV